MLKYYKVAFVLTTPDLGMPKLMVWAWLIPGVDYMQLWKDLC